MYSGRRKNGLTHVRVISSISDSMEPPHNNSNRNEHNGIKCDCLFKEQCKQSTKQKQDKEVTWMKHESQLELWFFMCSISLTNEGGGVLESS